ncbi:MAG TPA: DUF5668 domain-containing protein, partial [Aggregatilineales bacterium]|nr:DUF5668 domain-containing protein [Aggregatilineales bacterium]
LLMRPGRAPLFLPILLIGVGVVLLLRNFLLIENFDILQFWPVLLILAGLQLLIRGDVGITWHSQTFGITRGNVRTGTLEAISGELDMKLRALRREGRLIAGQYTGRSRPSLGVDGDHARLVLQRGQTWPFSLADWEIGLAKDLPWTVLLSAYLGELDIDLRGLRIEQANVASGIGDVRVVASDVPTDDDEQQRADLRACSTFGNVTLVIPPDVEAIVRVTAKPMARLQIDESRYLMLEPGVYATLRYEQTPARINAELSSTFGTVRLA